MKQLALLILAVLPCCGAWGNGYTYRRTLTIDKTKVPNTDQTNFPMLFSGTYDYLAHTTHSPGKVTDLNGYDIIFTSDAAGSTKLDHEIESYAHDTGVCVFWVRIPTVATASDTLIYVFYGNSSVTTSQQSIAGVWNSDYTGVWHLPNGATLSTVDSKGAFNFTNVNSVAAVTGKLDGGAGTFYDVTYLKINGDAAFNTANWTAEAWWYRTGGPATYGNNILAHAQSTGAAGHWALYGDAANKLVVDIPWVKGEVVVGGTTVPLNAWSHVVATKSGNTYTVYLNGASDGSASDASAPTVSGNVYAGGAEAGIGNPLAGSLDELRVSATARSGDWVATSYNNQSSPGTFYALGTEVAASQRRRVVVIQ